MQNRHTGLKALTLVILSTFALNGCTFIFQKGKRNDYERITQLKSQISELERAKAELEDRLGKEISDKEVKIEMLEKGLVITFVSEVLFDSGKAQLKPDSFQKLDKVANVINTTVRDLNIGIEGHTDNDPIRYSAWKTNWELSTGRALSVLHYLIDINEVGPGRLSVIGYGEFHPVESNDTVEGKAKNRRGEVVVVSKT